MYFPLSLSFQVHKEMVKERAKSLKAQEEKIAALMAKLQREKAKEVSSLYRY